ncbi:tRNA (guanine(10)-N2)-methyltransferase homolog isoform X1 [Numida meleagris]|uniref:tRNA (guanine(10)-N2)-methyltransferase homolog isoform X1 n=1 Tax=Numida meleagris TaxID=8996 RepID=UPI000B3DA563|nr:tRNA (guanine(10)-N2)-methyltransferase homolog isoform X1 [Numida meleagris]
MAAAGPALRRYLLLLAQEHLEFRLPEITSLLSLYGGQFSSQQEVRVNSPFWILNIPSEEMARGLMKRTVCAKSIFELWGHGRSEGELYASLKNYPMDKMLPYLQPDSTYKVHIHTYNKTLTQAQKIKKIDALEFLPFNGRVNLKNPEHIFWILEDYGMDPNNVPEEPFDLYFGRWIADGQRELIESYSIKKRHFIGNTSMDACLSFIMANHGRVKPNDIVYDPFVGTGGLLISSAHFGAYVCGTDIDYNTIHGLGKASRKNQKWRGPDENIRANLRQYGLEKYYLDALVSDSSRPIWRKGTLFDAIVTDPPYGIREATRRTGSQKEPVKSSERSAENHIIISSSYHLSDIFFDLLKFAAEYLVMGGRLVYWLPIYRPEYTEEIIPRHPCLKLISNCEQMLSSHTSRRLITMEKVKEFKDQDQNSYLLDGQYMPYKGHNSFREKYFSGVTKRIAKEEKDNQK